MNGARPNQSAYTLDGGLNMDMYNNVPAAFPNPDMLQEFSILQNGYSAVDGRDAGAVVNMITKSGTNRIHGSAYEFLRNSYADAKEEFATIVPPLRRNQYGGTVGGPVMLPHYNGRDRTFFFVGAELTRQSLWEVLISSTIVPTALERQGNFSADNGRRKANYGGAAKHRVGGESERHALSPTPPFPPLIPWLLLLRRISFPFRTSRETSTRITWRYQQETIR